MRASDVAGTTPRPDSIIPLPSTMVPTATTMAPPTPPIPPVDAGHLLAAQATDLLARTDARIGELFRAERAEWATPHPPLAAAFDTLERAVLCGGKRVRPLFAFHGFVAAAGDPADDRIVDLACALELLHAFALIHDDVMDDSATRRHQPTVHEDYRRRHEVEGWAGEDRRTAEAFAILLGDLAFAFSMRFELDLPPAVRRRLDQVRIELHVGQYLDLHAAASRSQDPFVACDIAHYKTARYTVAGPLVLGAMLAGCETTTEVLTAFGDAVGEAYQHRDDLLGVFGDPDVTGKPRYDDLHGGKSTLLLHLARSHDDGRAGVPFDLIGTDRLRDDDAAAIAAFMCASGAVGELEARIDALIDDAVAALDTIALPDASRAELIRLARLAGSRTS